MPVMKLEGSSMAGSFVGRVGGFIHQALHGPRSQR
jgi:hypothetical protein